MHNCLKGKGGRVRRGEERKKRESERQPRIEGEEISFFGNHNGNEWGADGKDSAKFHKNLHSKNCSPGREEKGKGRKGKGERGKGKGERGKGEGGRGWGWGVCERLDIPH